MKRSVLIIVCLMSLLNVYALKNNTEKLRTEFDRWHAFRCQGVIQINYGILSLRNNFVMTKNGNEMRLDILGGGAWGSGGTLISFYKGKYISVHSPMMPNLQNIDLGSMFPDINLDALLDPEIILPKFGEEILNTGRALIDSLEIHFNRNMQIERIIEPRLNLEVTIKYNRRNDPDTVTVKIQGKTVVLMQIDEIKFGEFPIEPLPPLFKRPAEPAPEIAPEPSPPHLDAE